MSGRDTRDKIRGAVASVVRKGGAAPPRTRSSAIQSPSQPRLVSDQQQAPGQVIMVVEVRGQAPDPYQDAPEARAIALAPLLEGERSFGLLRLGARWRLRSGAEKLDYLLSLPDPEATIQALAPEEFVFLAMDIGSADTAALMTLASPAQMQATVDLDGWRFDRLDRGRFAHWLAICAQTGEMTLDRFVASQQAATLTHFLAGSVEVFENREDADEALPTGAEIFTSPDGAFLVAARPEDPLLPYIRQLIDSLYRIGVEHGRKVVRAIRWELNAPLEDQLREDRERRVFAHGFVSRAEAREAYAPLRVEELEGRLDAAIAEQNALRPDEVRPFIEHVPRAALTLVGLDEGRILANALAQLEERERARLEIALTRLAYRLQSARADSAADIEALDKWTRHALATCDIGLAQISGGRLDRAVAALRHLTVLALFQCGHGLVVGLHHTARRLRAALGGEAALVLLDGGGADLIRGLVRGMPELALPAQAALVAGKPLVTKPFASLQEVQSARARLAQLRVAIDFVTSLANAKPLEVVADLRADMPEHSGDELRLSSLVGTAIAWTVLDGAPKLAALTGDEVRRFLQSAFEPAATGLRVRADLRAALRKSLLSSPHVQDGDVAGLEALLELVIDRFDAELGGLDPSQPIDQRFVGTAVAVK